MSSPEISDVIVAYDPATLERLPVRQSDAIAALDGPLSRYAQGVVRDIPTVDGVLLPEAVDALLVRAHSELQRLWEEFFHGPRIAELLTAIVNGLRASGISRKLRVVDIGCGTGFVLRWLAANQVLAGEVEWVGADYNRALVARAQKLSRAEQLDVNFLVANAFHLETPADIFISSAVLHHFGGADLHQFLASQAKCEPLAFAHLDIRRSRLASWGALVFHVARMREPLARYDGWLSAVRAIPEDLMEQALREHCRELEVGFYNPPLPGLPFVRTLTGVVGMPRGIAERFARDTSVPMRWLEA